MHCRYGYSITRLHFNVFQPFSCIWPVHLAGLLFPGVIWNNRHHPHVRFPVLILLVVVLLQFVDIRPLYQPKELTGISVFQSPLQSEFWKSAALTNKHVVIIPAKKLRPPYEPFAMYAVRNQLTLNLGYFARSDEQASQNIAKKYGKIYNPIDLMRRRYISSPTRNISPLPKRNYQMNCSSAKLIASPCYFS